MGKKWTIYTEYINSRQWQMTRKNAIAFRRNRCMVCKSRMSIQVHHMHYANLGHEKMTDLLVLCSDCHAQLRRQAKIGSKGFRKLNRAISDGRCSIEGGLLVILGSNETFVERAKSKPKRAKSRDRTERRLNQKRSQKSRVAEAKRHQANKVYNPFLGTWRTIPA